MKFKDRKQQRDVCETMADLLIPLKYKLNDKNRECVEITLRILSETEVVEDGNDN